MDEIYLCKDCGWIGEYDELNWIRNESCNEAEEVAICPECEGTNLHSEHREI